MIFLQTLFLLKRKDKTMYKKIYSKFTRERKEEFQIETAIYESDGVRYVVKRPLSLKSKQHVQQMYTIYNQMKNKGNTFLTDCFYVEDTAVFPFQKGKSFCTKLLESVGQKNKEEFYEILEEYRKLIGMFVYQDIKFVSTENFENTFGKHEELGGENAAIQINVDLTFDNIIYLEDGTIKIIDYEWIFDFAVPIKFVYFRAVNNFFIKYSNEVQEFIKRDEVLNFFGISLEKVYLEMDKCFVKYVYGGKEAYNTILEQYVKPYVDVVVQAERQQNNIVTQIYYDTGNGYTEENSNLLDARVNNDEVMVDFSGMIYGGIKRIRIDPCMEPSIVKNMEVTVYLENDEEIHLNAINTNAEAEMAGTYLFATEDPWIEYEYPSAKEKIVKINIKYLFVQRNAGELLELISKIGENQINDINEQNEIRIKSINERFDKKILDLDQKIVGLQEKNAQMKNMIDIYLSIKHCLEKQVNDLSNECLCLKKELGLLN